MNIIEIANECGFVLEWLPTKPKVSLLYCSPEQLEAFAAAISAKAIEDYKASLVPVAYANELGDMVLKVKKEAMPVICKTFTIPLYALTLGEAK